MKTTAATWILASACAALIAATAQAAPPNPRDSRHPNPRGPGQYSGHYRANHYGYRGPQSPVAYWGYYPPPPMPYYPPPAIYYPPPPPVVYCPPRPVSCYPVRPGFNIMLSF